MKQGKKITSLIALILCAVLAISGLCVETVYAANEKMSLKVGFKGKTINLIKDISDGDRYEMSIASVQKKWGKPKTKKSGYSTYYTWKKGKTTIEVSDFDATKDGKSYVGSITISIKDKNGSLWGVKVGMKAETALEKIKKAMDTENVVDNIDDMFGSGDVGVAYTKDVISAFTGPYMPINFELKNGKVTSIGFSRS